MQIGLKERLIGAVVLVILAVIIIPWVLKGGSAPSTTVTQPLALPQQVTTAPAAQTYHMALSGPASATGGLPASVASQSPPAPITALVQQPASRTAGSHVAVAVPPPHVTVSGKWVVQAGSYASLRNALAVEHKLVKHGFHAYVSRYHKNGRTYYRVRVGPYADRVAAERVVNEVARAYGGRAEAVPNN